MGDDKDLAAAFESRKALEQALKSPAYRIPVDMNINKFKKMLDNSDLILKKSERNRLVRQYKRKAWQEYDDIVKGMSSQPSRPIVVKYTGEENGKQAEQAADLSLA